jgi:hypothetical protein
VLLNALRKENDKLQRTAEEGSRRELQYIVRIKALEKRLREMEATVGAAETKVRAKEEELRDRESHFSRTVLLGTRCSNMDELRGRVAIDSIRRTTLRSLGKERLELQLQQEKWGLLLQSPSRAEEDEADSAGSGWATEETRCSDPRNG